MYLSTEKCKKSVIWIIFFLISLYLTKKLFVFLFPFFSSFFVAILFQKPIILLKTSLGISRKVSSFILLFVFILILLFSSYFLLAKIKTEFTYLLKYLPELKLERQYISPLLDKIITFSSSLGHFFPKALIFITVFVLSSFYLSAEYDIIEKRFPKTKRIKRALNKIISGYIKSYFILFLFTFAFLYLFFSLLKIKFSFILSLIISAIDIFPVLSAGIFIIPWGIFEFIKGARSLGFFLILSVLVLDIIKKFIEPKILGGFVGLHPLLSLAAISSGYLFMGVSGAFLFPFILSIIIELKKEM